MQKSEKNCRKGSGRKKIGKANIPCKAKLISAIFFSDRNILKSAALSLEEHFGPIDYRGEEFEFSFTDYYKKEMGTSITKAIWSFQNLISQDQLADIKVFTNELENTLPHNKSGGRLVNIDPGYLISSRLILASTKEYSHRIYLSKGIFAEITLVYKRKLGYEPLPWTYRDFKSERVRSDLKKIRSIYVEQLKNIN